MSCKLNHKEALLNSREFLIEQQAIDKLSTILNLQKFEEVNSTLSNDAFNAYGVEGNLWSEKSGRAVPNKSVLKSIDEKRKELGIYDSKEATVVSNIKPGVDFVFEQNPELEKIGDKQQYSKYLETVFPESKVKEIAYHSTDAIFEKFKPVKPNFDTLNSIEGVYNFTTNAKFSKRYGSKTLPVVLNVTSPIIETTTGEFVDDMDRPLTENLFRIGKQTMDNMFAPKFEEGLKNTDAVINYITGEDYIEKHPISGREFGLPKQTVISVFDPEQIRILGSKEDVQGFKEFVSFISAAQEDPLELVEDFVEEVDYTNQDFIEDRNSIKLQNQLLSDELNLESFDEMFPDMDYLSGAEKLILIKAIEDGKFSISCTI